LETVVVGHVLSAALNILGVPSIDNQLTGEGYNITSLEHMWTYTNEERKAVLNSICQKIVEKVVNFSINTPPDASLREDEVHNYAYKLLSII